ncbi:MAG: PEP-CTERM sorting domain-containing protein [Sphingobium sp.]|nr:PEP-CTERM sorting domain-containing protein [Sphingobium sp.]
MRIGIVVSAAALAAAAIPSHAATLYSDLGPTGPAESPSSYAFIAASSGGNGALSFTIHGYNSLDGVNIYEDDFTLALNSSPILQLSYDLGGGGGNAIFTNTYGATVSSRYDAGGHWAIDVSIATLPLLTGNNSFVFAYVSPTGDALGGTGQHFGPQGLGDEGWGLSNILLTGNAAVAPVPEPASWALMIGGIALAGCVMRRRKVAISFA